MVHNFRGGVGLHRSSEVEFVARWGVEQGLLGWAVGIAEGSPFAVKLGLEEAFELLHARAFASHGLELAEARERWTR